MLTDRENRPALAVTLAFHAGMMTLMAFATFFSHPFVKCGAALAMGFVLLCFGALIGAIAWVVEIPLIRRLHDDRRTLPQLACGFLFLLGIAVTIGLITETYLMDNAWSYAGFAALSGYGSFRQFRRFAEDDRAPAPVFPSARLVK